MRQPPGRTHPAHLPAAAGRLPAFIPLVIVAAGVIAYANSLSNPFILDDRTAIVENRQIRTLWPLWVPLSPPDETPVSRRPLVNLTFAVNYALGRLDVRGYHAGNLAVHLLAALSLFGLVRRTLQLPALADGFGHQATALAAAAALIWLLHPLQTEIINYVAQRTSALKGLCFLLTLYCSVRGLDPQSRTWRVLAVVVCAAGMASKESMVTAPLVVVFFDRTYVFASLAEALRRRGCFYAALACTWGVLAVLMASGARTTVGFDAGTTPWTYFLNQLAIFPEYLQRIAWPRALVVDYGSPVPLQLSDVWWQAALALSLGYATMALLWRRPRAGFPAAAAFIALAPTSTIVPIVTEVGAERRLYLPLAAFVVLVVCSLARYAGAGVVRRHRWMPAAAVGIVCALLAAGTVLRNREYRTPLEIARTTVERRPHGRAYFTLAYLLHEAGQRDEALDLFHRAAREFGFAGAHFALGTELMSDGDFEAAIHEFEAFLQLEPNHPSAASARLGIAIGLAAQGQTREALAQARAVLETGREPGRAHALVGRLLLAEGDAQGAVAHLETAVGLLPPDAALLRSLAAARSTTGDDAGSGAALEQALALEPEDTRTRDLLGVVLARQGRLSEAIEQFELATKLDPTYEPARAHLLKAQQVAAGTSGQSPAAPQTAGR